MRGPPKKPTALWEMEGRADHRNRKGNEPKYRQDLPVPPDGMTVEARRIWSAYMRTIAPGVLRLVDGPALRQLCEDKAMENRLRRGIRMAAAELIRKAKKSGEPVTFEPLTELASSISGRRMFATLAETISRAQRQEQQYGLTPASNVRVDLPSKGGGGFGTPMDPLERALCG